MYNMIQKRKAEMKKNNKKGFTLVEVIVVLVILAILAAILIPSMIGWIDRANNKSALVEARSVLLASQTVASENYATDKTATSVAVKDVTDLADVDGTISAGPVVDKGKVTSFTYKTKAGVTVVYDSTKSGSARFAVQ